MSYKIIKKLPTWAHIISQIPLSDIGYKNIEQHKSEIRDILSGMDTRLIVIVGPCSAWPYDAVLTYADRLVALDKEIKHKIKIVMRTYIQKPRTIKGWTGPANQPDPLSHPDIELGMYYSRKLMVAIAEKNLAIADEALFTHNARGFIELLSWVAIGARSSEDQEHRVFASSIDCPVGIKNPTNGSIKVGVNGIIAAQHPHVAVFDGYEVETAGNKYAHLVLRGGNGKSNYSLADLRQAQKSFIKADICNPAIIIDVSHDNCLVDGVKQYQRQGEIIFEIMQTLAENPDLGGLVKGFMLESFLKSGRQNIEAGNIDMSGLSITDPCLSWGDTEALLSKLADAI